MIARHALPVARVEPQSKPGIATCVFEVPGFRLWLYPGYVKVLRAGT